MKTHKNLAVMMVALGVLATGTVANAWTDFGNFTQVRVLDHNFERVRVRSSGCFLYFTVYFYAPYYRYQSSYQENYFRFQAKVELDRGAWVRTPLFFNGAPGRREYTYTYNTAHQGCWGMRYHRVRHLTVNGCQGRGCYVRPVTTQTQPTWNDTGYFHNLWVKGYRFSSVNGANLSYNTCKLKFTVKFSSPSTFRHNIRATVTLGAGYRAKIVTSPMFYNSGVGEREYTWYHDTAPDGCWGSSFRKVRHLQVKVW